MQSMRQRLKNHFIPHEGNDYKPHAVRSQALIFSLMLGFGILVMALLGSRTVSEIPGLADVQSTYLAQVTNEKRIENKVGELTVNPLLQEAARLKAQDMIENEYFAHVSPQGKQPWHWMNLAGYKYKYAGENLAIDFYDTKEVAEAWMNSPTHRRNILNNNYSEIGIAVDTGRYKGRKVAFVVQMFGSPRYASTTNSPSQVATTPSQEEVARRVEELRAQIALRQEALRQAEVLGESTEKTEIIEEEIQQSQEVLGAMIADTTKLVQIDDYQSPNDEPVVIEGVVSSDDSESAELIVTTTEGSFIETVYNGDDYEVGEAEQDSAAEQERIDALEEGVSRPMAVAKTALLILIALIAVSLVLKIVIEIKKQHYKNVILAVLVLIALVLIYLIVDQQMGQVIVL